MLRLCTITARRCHTCIQAPYTMTLSIITVTYNNLAGLENTVQEITQLRKHLDIEYIVIDGGSNDGSREFLQTCDIVDQWISEPDDGIYAAMNKGINIATGHHIYFCNTGDSIQIEGFVRFYKSLTFSNLALYYANVFYIPFNKAYCGKQYKINFLRKNICHQSIIYTSDIFSKIGAYNLRYSLLADYSINIACFGDREIKKIYVNEVIADYEGNGASAQRKDQNFYQDLPILFNQHFGVFYCWLYFVRRFLILLAIKLGLRDRPLL